jgi:glutathione S-transferase
MLRILGKRQSINVRKVLWACDEIGVPYSQEEWGAGTRATSEAEFRLLNPKGLVPVIVDGDKILTESNTIVRYLSMKHGRADLLPLEPLARARVEEVMDWQATELNWSWRVAFQSIVRRNEHAGTADQIAESLAEWTRMMLLLEERLSDAWLCACGTDFTAADIVIGLSINRWFQTPMERPALPHIESYFRKLIERPAAAPYLGGNTD